MTCRLQGAVAGFGSVKCGVLSRVGLWAAKLPSTKPEHEDRMLEKN